MASRQSKRRSRAQKRRRHSMRGGRREETKPVVEEEKKEEAPTEGGLFGLFSGDAKKDDATAEETAAPIEETAAPVEGAAPAEETAAPAPTEGADAVPTEGATKKKGKKRRHGKYYTPKQLKEACKRLSSKKRHHKNRPFPRERRGPMMMEQTSNPYAFGERPM